MKHQHEALTQDLQKRLNFLDKYKKIRDEENGATEGNKDAKDEEEPRNLSPSTEFFLTK